MIFTRTNSGLSNFSSFFDCDITIYTEGGSNEDNGNRTKYAVDTIFWKSAFGRYAPDKKIKLKPMGSKQNLLPIAQKIKDGEINNSIVVLDRDYDSYRGIALQHSRIIYSYGYSWENDAWRKGIIRSYLEEVHPLGELSAAESSILNSSYLNFEKNISRLALADVICSLNGIQGTPREGADRYIEKKGPYLLINKKICKQEITAANKRKQEKLLIKTNFKTCPYSDCYGKIAGSFGYFVLKEILSKTSPITTLPKEVANQIITTHFKSAKISEYEPIIDNYYKDKITAAL